MIIIVGRIDSSKANWITITAVLRYGPFLDSCPRRTTSSIVLHRGFNSTTSRRENAWVTVRWLRKPVWTVILRNSSSIPHDLSKNGAQELPDTKYQPSLFDSPQSRSWKMYRSELQVLLLAAQQYLRWGFWKTCQVHRSTLSSYRTVQIVWAIVVLQLQYSIRCCSRPRV